MQEKLHKVLAAAGRGSRRQLELLIAQGRVMVNGQVAQLGDRLDLTQPAALTIDRQRVVLPATTSNHCQVLLYYKPEGELCTRADPQGRPTIFSSLPRLSGCRWITIGRLDINTSGLLLLTTEGELANRLMHPRYQIERQYAVRIFGQVDAAMLGRLQQGVSLADGPARFKAISAQGGQGLNQWFTVTLTEGRQREVRRLWQSQGVAVSRLIRIRYGTVCLPKNLARGRWRELSLAEVAALRQHVGLSLEVDTPPLATAVKKLKAGSGSPPHRRKKCR